MCATSGNSSTPSLFLAAYTVSLYLSLSHTIIFPLYYFNTIYRYDSIWSPASSPSSSSPTLPSPSSPIDVVIIIGSFHWPIPQARLEARKAWYHTRYVSKLLFVWSETLYHAKVSGSTIPLETLFWGAKRAAKFWVIPVTARNFSPSRRMLARWRWQTVRADRARASARPNRAARNSGSTEKPRE